MTSHALAETAAVDATTWALLLVAALAVAFATAQALRTRSRTREAGPRAGERPTVDPLTSEDVHALAATGAIEADQHLITHPSTGRVHRRSPAPAKARDPYVPPSVRARTLLENEVEMTNKESLATPPRSARTSTISRADVKTLTVALSQFDLDPFVAFATTHPTSAPAAHLVAASIATHTRDSRASGYLARAFNGPLSFTQDPLLGKLKAPLTFSLHLPDVAWRASVPATPTSLALALALTDYAIGDPDRAASTLETLDELDLAEEDPQVQFGVAALRVFAAIDADEPSDATEAAAAYQPPATFAAPAALLRAAACTTSGDLAEAATALADCERELPRSTDADADLLQDELDYWMAAHAAKAGATKTARVTLSTLLDARPHHERAADLLASL